MTTSLSDAVHQTERALLGSLLLDNSLWRQIEALGAQDFGLDAHRRIYGRIAAMFEGQRPVDIVTLTLELAQVEQLAICGDSAYLASLLEHAFPENFAAYVREVSQAARDRRYNHLSERLADATASDERLEILQQMQELLKGRTAMQDWRPLFHTRAEIENAPPLRFAIDGFLQEEGITLIGGLAGHGKTLCMLSMVRALLEHGALFTKFQALRPAERVLYLIPEAGIGPFSARLRTFRLLDYVGNRLFVQTLSAKNPLTLSDPRLLKAAEGADIFLDTAIRFMQGDENDASEQRAFAESLFNLQAAGARTITGAHHSPKAFSKDTVMTLENVLRGSGDIGAMLCTAWGLKQVDSSTNSIYVANVKPRDFQPCEPFIIQGRPSLDQTGYFEMTHPPGFAGSLSDHAANVGRPAMADKDQKAARAREMKTQGASYREIAKQLGVSVGTVSGWLSQ
jgi:hypothetical protein